MSVRRQSRSGKTIDPARLHSWRNCPKLARSSLFICHFLLNRMAAARRERRCQGKGVGSAYPGLGPASAPASGSASTTIQMRLPRRGTVFPFYHSRPGHCLIVFAESSGSVRFGFDCDLLCVRGSWFEHGFGFRRVSWFIAASAAATSRYPGNPLSMATQ